MVAVNELRQANQEAVKEAAVCLKSLFETYPLAYAYRKEQDLRKNYVTAKACYAQTYEELVAVGDNIQKTLSEALAKNRRTVSAVNKLRLKNERRVVELQRSQNAASGAIGLYDDMSVQYNAKVLEIILLLAGCGAMSLIVYNEQA